MAKGKGFELVPQHVPLRQRSSFYKEMITEFLNSGEKSVVVAGTDRKPATLVQGLRKVIQSDGIKNVKVLQRSSDVYLSK